MPARGKRPARGNGKRNPAKTAGRAGPHFHPAGTYYYQRRPCRVTEHHPETATTPEQFTIEQDNRLRLVPRRHVFKQPHPPRTKAPFTRRTREGK